MANITFLTGGDVAPSRENAPGLLGAVASRFRQSDVAFLNLENGLSQKGELLRGKPYYHRGAPKHIEGLLEARFTCFNMANNHILDFGDPALFETLELLDRHGIGRFGAGRNIDEARRPYIVEKKGLRFGFLGYTTTLPIGFAATATAAGVNPLQVHTAYQPRANPSEYPGVTPTIVTWTDPAHLQGLKEAVIALRKQVDIVLIYVHWGSSMTPYVHDFQREIARAAIDSGAHGLFGGHQHVVSAIEFYKGCPIVYGSGNLLFDKWEPFFSSETLKTFLFGATVDAGGLRDCYLLPAKNGVGVPPVVLPRDDALRQEIYHDLEKQCRAFGTQLVERDGAVELRPA